MLACSSINVQLIAYSYRLCAPFFISFRRLSIISFVCVFCPFMTNKLVHIITLHIIILLHILLCL
jgi:hypothetical protein